mgnify:CR=1 FL=1
MGVDHYENFPVASVLCPPALRPAVVALYGFARTADDLADEGDADASQRLADLAAYRADLVAVMDGRAPSDRWVAVFTALDQANRRHHLPAALLHDLVSAFEQDVRNPPYADRDALLDYCRLSANPVGRLLLHLYGVNAASALAESDAICSALQLINFWQDLGIDQPRRRNYLPHADLRRHGLPPPEQTALVDGPAVRALVRDLCDWARALMLRGAPLVRRLPGRAGWELRLVVQGGLRILEKIARLDHGTLQQRPRLRGTDAPLLLWRAATMRATSSP